MLQRLLLISFIFALPGLCQADMLRLATTTSTYNSGLLDYLLPDFQQRTGTEVQVIAVGTGKALRMGQNGDVDVVLVHAPVAEQRFVQKGYGSDRLGVMYNDFVIVGPGSDPAGIRALTEVTDALATIAEKQALFVSRGDDSGTHKKELSLWTELGTVPEGSWYRETGQGMGKVLQISDELGAYTLVDRGTWLAWRHKLSLELMLAGDSRLHNPYSVIRINPRRFADLNHAGAEAFSQWLVSEPVQQRIAAFQVNGEALFVPAAN